MFNRRILNSLKQKVPFAWKEWWKHHLPPRVKMLGWHIAWNVLPSGDVLNHKNISVNLNCELCDNTNESLTRLFINDMTWCQQPRKFPYQQQSNLAINITFLI